VWNNLHITADIIFRPTMTHVAISLRGQLDIQRQALRHDIIHFPPGIFSTLGTTVTSKSRNMYQMTQRMCKIFVMIGIGNNEF
jgi:hypothetical protein